MADTMKNISVMHAGTLLPDGDVVLTGGFAGTSPHAQVDLYHHASQTFVAAGHMVFNRASHRQVLTASGQILIIGGTTLEGGILSVDELYDPATKHSSAQGSLTENRAGHTATLLPSGKAYVA